ncbi:hypothetical protein POX_c04558 [Penicillium oxalicum]|uniref:hypothetical protein n=1 Tax=Penicillium oxalicum TaxID=69781 RepID=UPI0020B77C5D|nr:hypothetical protein POX_c04558 [Penicillium oxalicum]KAI2791689.1 hypothetical protein POX_c04558 [Penicillium oxalicum]
MRLLLCETLDVSLLEAPQSVYESLKTSDGERNAFFIFAIFIEVGIMPSPPLCRSITKIFLNEPGSDVLNHILEEIRKARIEARTSETPFFACNVAKLFSIGTSGEG